MKLIKVLASLAVAVLITSCGGPQESEAIKEAKKLHEQLVRISGDLHDELMVAMAPLEGQIDSAMMVGDTLLAAELAKLEGQLDRIDVRFHDWSETVVEISGQLMCVSMIGLRRWWRFRGKPVIMIMAMPVTITAMTMRAMTMQITKAMTTAGMTTTTIMEPLCQRA